MSLLRARLAVLALVVLGAQFGATATAAVLCCHENCRMAATATDEECHDVDTAPEPGTFCHLMDASTTERDTASLRCGCGGHDTAVKALLGLVGLTSTRIEVDRPCSAFYALEVSSDSLVDWIPAASLPPPRS